MANFDDLCLKFQSLDEAAHLIDCALEAISTEHDEEVNDIREQLEMALRMTEAERDYTDEQRTEMRDLYDRKLTERTARDEAELTREYWRAVL